VLFRRPELPRGPLSRQGWGVSTGAPSRISSRQGIRCETSARRRIRPPVWLCTQAGTDGVQANVFNLGTPVIRIANGPMVEDFLPNLHLLLALLGNCVGTASPDEPDGSLQSVRAWRGIWHGSELAGLVGVPLPVMKSSLHEKLDPGTLGDSAALPALPGDEVRTSWRSAVLWCRHFKTFFRGQSPFSTSPFYAGAQAPVSREQSSSRPRSPDTRAVSVCDSYALCVRRIFNDDPFLRVLILVFRSPLSADKR
jgi:hypothetical protein